MVIFSFLPYFSLIHGAIDNRLSDEGTNIYNVHPSFVLLEAATVHQKRSCM